MKSKILSKENKKINNNLYAFIIFIALGALFIAIGIYENNKLTNSYTYLNDVIVNKNNESNINDYLDITFVPYSFAKYEDDSNHSFYIAYDNRYYYIVYLSDSIYNELNEIKNFDIVTLYGTTQEIPDNVKELATLVYNNKTEIEDQITLDDFNRYFGGVYLNNVTIYKQNIDFYIISIIPFCKALIFLITFIYKKIRLINKILKNS